jgi:hypothetical protein
MKILLINSNPVVSRLTALSARKEEIQIDEVQEVNEVSHGHYDIVFVDADSWNKDVDSAITQNIKTEKKVLFYAQDDSKSKELFDISILKPFLPSEVSAVIRLVEESIVSNDKSSEKEATQEKRKNTPERPKEEKKDDLLRSLNDDLDFEEKVTTLVKDKAIESKSKTDNRDEDIFAELKDDPKSFDKELEKAFPLKEKELESEALFELDLKDDDKLEASFVALEKNKNSKIEEENHDLFEFDLDSTNELNLNLDTPTNAKPEEKAVVQVTPKIIEKKEEPIKTKSVEPKIETLVEKPIKKPIAPKEEKIETKILDKDELSTIKDILENDKSVAMELEDLMTTQPATVNLVESSKKEKKRKSKKVKVSSEVGSEVLADTLASLPIETLRGLLAGANIKISIKFPKDK